MLYITVHIRIYHISDSLGTVLSDDIEIKSGSSARYITSIKNVKVIRAATV